MKRNFDILTEKENCLEHLITFKNVPVLMGATDQEIIKDKIQDQSWYISSDTGIIQLNPLVDPDILYNDYHNPGTVGGLWKEHHHSFAEFVGSDTNNVLEIGAGSGSLAKYYTEQVNINTNWTIIDPNCDINEGKISSLKAYFPISHIVKGRFDTVVHSHVLEHMYEPNTFLQDITKILGVGGKHYFTFPNMKEMLKEKYTNTLCFEHVSFLREEYVDTLLENNGFDINSKFYFRKHSIFYETTYTGDKKNLSYPNFYTENKNLFLEMYDYYEKLISRCNEELRGKDKVWLFGASIFSQYLLFNNLYSKNIVGILDNDKTKTGKRLYGTPYTIDLPEVIADEDTPAILVFAGAYQDEIEKQLLQINENVKIIR
jgi:cyclopropane fatty-acyl-phospholipid synthase-like methyltransferase